MSLNLTFRFDLYYMSSISWSHVGVAPSHPALLAVDYVDIFGLCGMYNLVYVNRSQSRFTSLPSVACITSYLTISLGTFRLKNTIMKCLHSLQYHLSNQYRQQHHQISHHQSPLNHQHPVFRVGLVDLQITNWGIHCSQVVHMMQ